MKLSEKLMKLRKMKGWSQEEFAEKMDVSRQAISRWETGSALPDVQNVLQMSKLFGVTTDYLLNEDVESDDSVQQTPLHETEMQPSKKKMLHLFASFCFMVSAFCALVALIESRNEIQSIVSVFFLTFNASLSVAQLVLYLRKR